MTIITLQQETNHWSARFHGDQNMINAFGTDIIPTPFTEKADFETVKEAIAEANPGATIVFSQKA